MPPSAESTLALTQARARWGQDVVAAGLFRPGPDPTARTALAKSITRRTNRRRAGLPGRLLVAINTQGQALMCPLMPDAQGGHPEGKDLYAGPFEELGAMTSGQLAIVVLLDSNRPAILEAVWLDHDAASVAALLTGEPVPDSPDQVRGSSSPGAGRLDDHDDDEEPAWSSQALLAQAEETQARADSLRALAAEVRIEETAANPPQTGP